MDRRRHPRFSIPPMYSPVEVVCPGGPGPDTIPVIGHAYDVGPGGLWFELDDRVNPGDELRLRVVIPGLRTPVELSVRVVRIEGEDDLPPYRVGASIERFRSELDRVRLGAALSQRRAQAAA